MYDATVLADSMAPNGSRLITLEVTFPRFILAEVNTHRVFSRNSASSRAIPFKKQVEMINEHPFVPEAWPTEQKGMSGGDPLTGLSAEMAEDEWMRAMEHAIRHATRLSERGTHKSLANRLLEPFMWHKAILSSTTWANLLALRCPPGNKPDVDFPAQPEFQRVAILIRDAIKKHEPKTLQKGDWHLPLISALEYEEILSIYDDEHIPPEISAGRCARVSYMTQGKPEEFEVSLNRAHRLINSGHWSPFEHQAQAAGDNLQSGNFIGFEQFRKMFAGENDYTYFLPNAIS